MMNLRAMGLRGKILVLAIQLCGAMALSGASAHFDDADRGPGGSFQVGDITVSAGGGPFYGSPATVSGYGLGSAGPVGENYSFDQRLHYSPGQSFPDTTARENSVTFEIDPSYTFTSLTLRPYLRVEGSAATPPCSFTMEYDVTGTSGPWLDQYFFSANPGDFGQPITLSLNPRSGMEFYRFNVQIDTALAGGEALNFYQYRQDHLDEDQTIQFGFTIQSLDYALVPEPGAATLLILGCFVYIRRRIR